MKDITKYFSGVQVLDKVCLKVMPGEVHALMGENGAGKSTLMNILMGIHTADGGEIFLEGKEISNKTPREAMDRGISMIHQELHPIRDMDVTENIFLGREIRKGTDGIISLVNKKEMLHKARELFEELGIAISPSALMRDLSVAQCQLIEMVKAISISAKVIIMDEPTSAITDKEVDILFKQIRYLKSKGVSIIYISHKMDEIFQIADSITVLRDGQYIGTDASANLNNDKLISMMVGREISGIYPKETVSIGDVTMEVKNLSWGKRVRNVNFELHQGEILGLAGLVGAGRSELVETLFGINSKTSGEIYIRGNRTDIRRPADAISHRIALITEDRKRSGLNLIGSITENVTLASLGSLFSKGIINKKLEGSLTEESIKKHKVKTVSRKALVKSLSGGNQQKVVIAKWLLTEPDIIIMDEPTRGIDVGAKRDIYLLLGELVKAGKSVLVISSEIPEIMGIADRILIMAEGQVTGELMREEFTQEKIMHYASKFNKGKKNEK